MIDPRWFEPMDKFMWIHEAVGFLLGCAVSLVIWAILS